MQSQFHKLHVNTTFSPSWKLNFIVFGICSQLCILLNAEVIYRIFAEIIFEETINLKFASIMVRTLNTILLTTSELFELRVHLKDITNAVNENETNKFSNRNIFGCFSAFVFILFHSRNQLPYFSAFICRGRIVRFQRCHCVYWLSAISMYRN